MTGDATSGALGHPIHVAVDATSLAWGWSGIPKYTQRIVREWVGRRDVDVTLLANARPDTPLPIEGIRQVTARRRGGGFWRNQFASRWVQRERPDVYWAPEMVLPRRLAAPSVVTVHDLGPITHPETKSARARAAFRALGASARRATRVIAVSEWTKQEIVEVLGVADRQIAVIPNGVDLEFAPGDRAAATADVERRWNVGPPFVLAVGTLERRKGLDVVLEAAGAVSNRAAPWHLVLAGSLGDHGAEIATAADAVPGCRRLGRVTDEELVRLYRAADAVVTPSRAEGFGIVPLEAMACGTPAVIAGGSGGLEEVSGAVALVVRERTATAWLDAIERARQRDPALVRAGIELAGRYRWSRAADATLEVLCQAALTRR